MASNQPDSKAASSGPFFEPAKLKVLQLKGRKMALKLEPIYWSQLAEFSREDRTTVAKLVFRILFERDDAINRASALRCYCLGRLQKRPSVSSPSLKGPTFDLFALISACPSPAAILTGERRLVAVNPAFSLIVQSMRNHEEGDRAINLTFSEPLPRIQKDLIEKPTEIRVYHLGLHLGAGKSRHFRARFALAERNFKTESLIAVFLEK
jgi:predicted DNA-binding ribbon-helix-helix protein